MGTKYLYDHFIDQICGESGFDEFDFFLAVSCDGPVPDRIHGSTFSELEHGLDQFVMNCFNDYEIWDKECLIKLIKEEYPEMKDNQFYVEFINNYHEQIANEYGSDPWRGRNLLCRISFHTEASIVINEDFDDNANRTKDISNTGR
jgi:hypothetical protein